VTQGQKGFYQGRYFPTYDQYLAAILKFQKHIPCLVVVVVVVVIAITVFDLCSSADHGCSFPVKSG
jgi:hypothetical protein